MNEAINDVIVFVQNVRGEFSTIELVQLYTYPICSFLQIFLQQNNCSIIMCFLGKKPQLNFFFGSKKLIKNYHIFFFIFPGFFFLIFNLFYLLIFCSDFPEIFLNCFLVFFSGFFFFLIFSFFSWFCSQSFFWIFLIFGMKYMGILIRKYSIQKRAEN